MTTVISVETRHELSLRRLCRLLDAPPAWIADLVAHGVLEVRGDVPVRWRFDEAALARTLRARRLQRDLGLNTQGVALALDLLDEVGRLRRRVRMLQRERETR